MANCAHVSQRRDFIQVIGRVIESRFLVSHRACQISDGQLSNDHGVWAVFLEICLTRLGYLICHHLALSPLIAEVIQPRRLDDTNLFFCLGQIGLGIPHGLIQVPTNLALITASQRSRIKLSIANLWVKRVLLCLTKYAQWNFIAHRKLRSLSRLNQ